MTNCLILCFGSPPGHSILELCQDRGLSYRECADALFLSKHAFYKLSCGQLKITHELAQLLELVFPGVPKDFWIAREYNYRQRLKQLKNEINKA